MSNLARLIEGVLSIRTGQRSVGISEENGRTFSD